MLLNGYVWFISILKAKWVWLDNSLEISSWAELTYNVDDHKYTDHNKIGFAEALIFMLNLLNLKKVWDRESFRFWDG